MITIPLSYRLPNARHVEGLEALVTSLDEVTRHDEPLVHVVDAHARQALAASLRRHRQRQAWRTRIVYIELEHAHTSALDLCHLLLDVFARLCDAPRSTPYLLEDALTSVIDFCEQHELELVLGQASRLSELASHTLSEVIVAHAHASRWYWLWENAPAQMSGIVVGDVSSGASAWADAPDALDASAWRVLCVLSDGAYTIVERDLLSALGIDREVTDSLIARGLVTRLPSGLALTERGEAARVHARDASGADAMDIDALLCDFVMALAAVTRGEAQVGRSFDAFRCATSHGMIEEIETILSAHFESFRRADRLTDVYVRLIDLNDPRLRPWLFRASCYMSDFDRAETLRWREELELQDAMYWIYLLLTRGRFEQLHEMASSLLEAHEHEEMTPQEKMCCEQIRLLRARAFIQGGEHDRALQAIEPVLGTQDDWMQLNVLFVQVRALAYAGHIKKGRELLPGLLQRTEALPLDTQRKWATFIIQACYVLKFYEDAARFARRFFGDTSSLNHVRSTAPILLGALWTELGDEEMASRAISFSREALRESPAMSAMIINIDLADAIARGDIPRMSACITQFSRLNVARASATSREEHHALHRMAWLLFGARLDAPRPHNTSTGTDTSSAFVRCFETLWQAAHLDDVSEREEHPRSDDEESYLFEVLCQAWLDALAGRSRVDALERAVLVARQFAMYRVGQEVAQMCCIHSFLFEPSRLDVSIERLAELATMTRSARFEQEVRWWRMIQQGARLGVREAEALVDELSESSLANQVLAHMLDTRRACEPLARMLAARMTSEVFIERVRAADEVPEGTSSAALTLHLDSGEVWVPGSTTTLELDVQQVGFQLLRCLADRQHEPDVDKETLITCVWPDLGEYHPLRHDNRLRVAMRKLRKELRSGLGDESPWIETTESGYAMACRVRLVEHVC